MSSRSLLCLQLNLYPLLLLFRSLLPFTFLGLLVPSTVTVPPHCHCSSALSLLTVTVPAHYKYLSPLFLPSLSLFFTVPPHYHLVRRRATERMAMTNGSEFWGPAGLLSPRCMAAGCSPAVDGER